MMRTILAGGLVCAALVLPAAAQDDIKPIEAAKVDLGRPVDFTKDIVPILDANCIACHNVIVDESKLVLEEVPAILKGGKRGPSVVPGQPEKSLLFTTASRHAKPAMPPMPNDAEANVLTPKQLGLIKQWIVEGAKESTATVEKVIAWQPIPDQAQAIYALALSPWSNHVVASRANRISVFDVAGKREVASLNDPGLAALKYNDSPMYPGGAAHRDFVHSLAYSPDGEWIASGGYRVVKLWKKNPAQLKQLVMGGDITALAVSPDGKWAAVGLADNTIQVWSLGTIAASVTLSGHEAAVNGLAFHPEGLKLVSGSADKTIRVWNLTDGKQLSKVTAPADIRSLVLKQDASQVITGDGDNIIRVYAFPAAGDNADAKPVAELPGHAKPVTSLALILPAGTQLLSGSEDGTAKIWDINGKKAIRSLALGAPVTGVAVRPDGQAVAASAENNIARVFDMNGKQLAEIRGNITLKRGVVVQTDDQSVAKQKLALADAAEKAADKNLKDRQEAVKKADEAVKAAVKALEEAQKKAKEATDKVAAAKAELDKKPEDAGLKKKHEDAQKEAEKQDGELKKAESGKTSSERALKLAQDSVKTAETQLADRKKRKADAEARQKEADAALAAAQKAEQEGQRPVRAITFSADGGRLITGGDDNVVQVWDAATGEGISAHTGASGAILNFATTNGGKLLAASADKSLRLLNIDPTYSFAGRLGPAGDDPTSLTGSPFASRVTALAFSPDGKQLATGGGEASRSGELILWDVAGKKPVRTIEEAHSDLVLDIEFSRDGQLLLTGSADKFMKVFDVNTGEHVRSFEGHTHHVLGVAWKADGASAASAGADNAIKVWNVETGEQRRTISNYSKQVTAIQYMGTSDNMVSCSGDKAVKYHTGSNGRNYRSFGGAGDYVYAVAASRDEKLVVAGGEDGVLRIWNGTNSQVLVNFEPPVPAEDAQVSAK